MFLTLIQKEMMHHILSVRFVALLLMCLLLIPLTLSINYRSYRQDLVDYQEAVKLANIEEKTMNPKMPLEPEVEVSKLILKPTPLSVFANGLEDSLPSYLGMTRNGITPGIPSTFSAPLSELLGHLDFLFVVSTVFSLLALLFTFDVVAGEREIGTIRITLSNAVPRDLFLWGKLIGGYLVFVVPFLVSFLFGLLLLVWQGFPLGESRHFSTSPQSDGYLATLYRGVFCNRNRDFYLLGQCQNSPYHRFHRLGVRRVDYATSRFSCGEGYRPSTNRAERLYGEKSRERRSQSGTQKARNENDYGNPAGRSRTYNGNRRQT